MDFGSQVILLETVLCSGVVVDAYVRGYGASHGASAGLKARLATATGTAVFLLLVGSAPPGELGYAILWGLIAQGIAGALAERVLSWRGVGLAGSMTSLFKWTAVPAWFVGLVFLGVAALGSLEARSVTEPLTGERWILITALMGVATALGFLRDCIVGYCELRIPVARTIDLTDPERDPRLTRWLAYALSLWLLAAFFAWTKGEGSATLQALKTASIACTAICLVSMLPRRVFVPRKNETKWAGRMERLEGMAQAATLLGAAALLAPGI